MRVSVIACVALASSISAAVAQQTQPLQPAAQPQKAQATVRGQNGNPLGSHDPNAPINVASDTFEGDIATKVGTYIGNVIVTQADYKLRSDKLRVEMVDGKPNRLFAYGNVVFDSSSGTATGDNGVYDLGPRTVTMTGKVVLIKGKDVMRGTLLVVDMNTHLAHLTAKGTQSGRVQSTFIPPPSSTRNSPKPKDGATN